MPGKPVKVSSTSVYNAGDLDLRSDTPAWSRRIWQIDIPKGAFWQWDPMTFYPNPNMAATPGLERPTVLSV